MKPNAQQMDDLTRLFSRRAFLEQFSLLLIKAKTSQPETPISLVLMDVDNFKSINDQYGHIAGDDVLVAVAQDIQEHAGKDALAGRYGGDEFVVVFPGDEREQAFLKAELIRQAAGRHELATPDGKKIPGIPISAGVASFTVDGRTENELWRKADHALYRAKVGGRNQVRLAYEERMVPKTTHYTQIQLERLSKLAEQRGVNEADLLREAMDDFLTKYGVNDIET